MYGSTFSVCVLTKTPACGSLYVLARLAADDVTDAGFGHQVAFVAGVDEDAGVEGAAAFHLDGVDDAAGLGDAIREVEPLAFDDGDVRQAGDPLIDHRLADFGLKPIGGALVVGLANAGVELVERGRGWRACFRNPWR